MERKVFSDPDNQAFYEKNGYVKLQLLNADEIASLIEFHKENHIPVGPGFATTYPIHDLDLKSRINKQIMSIVYKKIEPVFINYKPTIAVYISKHKNTNDIFVLHQDQCFVDESKGFRTFNVWCPLLETNENNGMLFAIPGSHLLKRYPRSQPDGLTGKFTEFLNGYSRYNTPLPTKLGEAIIFDNGTFHGSYPNKTDDNRLVAGVLMAPAEAAGLLYYKNPDGSFEVYATDENFHHNSNLFEHNSGNHTGTLPPVDEALVIKNFTEIFGEPQINEVVSDKIEGNWLQRLFKLK